MPRVLLFHQPVDGGVARNVVDIARHIGAWGWEAVTCGPAPPAASRNAQSVNPGAHIEFALGRAPSPGPDGRAIRGFRTVVRELQPDVVHAHSSKAGAVARLALGLQPEVPVVYTPHGFAFAGYFRHEIERRAYRAVERALVPATRTLLAVSRAEAQLAAGIGAARRTQVVHNGVSVAKDGPADPRVAALRDRGPVICAVTLLRPGKGVETLLEAFAAVLRREPATQLVIVGDGADRQPLMTLAGDLGVAAGLHWLGQCDDPALALRAADLFVLPSWAESFPYVLLEAMAVGLPIVATRVGGVPEAVTPGLEGLLVAPRDSAALAGGLIELLDDRNRAAALARAAQRRAAAEFTLGAMVERTARVYASARRRV